MKITKPRTVNPEPATVNPEPRTVNSLRKHLAFWSLTFNGEEACFEHEQGAYYVAYLLLNPPDEPIHGMALEVKSDAYFGQLKKSSGLTEIVDPVTGARVTLAYDAVFEERNLALDEDEGVHYLRRKQQELEAILQDESASEPVKAEVQRELEELYAYEKKKPVAPMTTAQKVVRSVRMAIRRFHEHLAGALDAKGSPHPVLRPFAAHLERYMLIPTARYAQPGTLITREGPTGRFTYEPPKGVVWSK